MGIASGIGHFFEAILETIQGIFAAFFNIIALVLNTIADAGKGVVHFIEGTLGFAIRTSVSILHLPPQPSIWALYSHTDTDLLRQLLYPWNRRSCSAGLPVLPAASEWLDQGQQDSQVQLRVDYSIGGSDMYNTSCLAGQGLVRCRNWNGRICF